MVLTLTALVTSTWTLSSWDDFRPNAIRNSPSCSPCMNTCAPSRVLLLEETPLWEISLVFFVARKTSFSCSLAWLCLWLDTHQEVNPGLGNSRTFLSTQFFFMSLHEPLLVKPLQRLHCSGLLQPCISFYLLLNFISSEKLCLSCFFHSTLNIFLNLKNRADFWI